MDTTQPFPTPDIISVDILRHDVQKLHYLKEFARSSASHAGVFTSMSERAIDEALRNKATFIMGGPSLNTRIQHDNKYYSRFRKHPYVEIYDKRGNDNTSLIGVIGHIDNTQIIIHPVGQSWVHPIVAHDFKDGDLVYAYPRPGVICENIQLYPPHLKVRRFDNPQ